jgi:uncharacterized heparinase superfamily protein
MPYETDIMTLRLPATVRTMIFASRAYNLLLGQKPPKSVRVPKGIHGLSAQASRYALQQRPTSDIPTHQSRGDFGWLAGTSHTPSSVWPVISEWLAHNSQWQFESWRVDIVAARITNWISAFDHISPHIDPVDQQLWATSIRRQAKHLQRIASSGIHPWQKLIVHQARINSALAMPEFEAALPGHLTSLGLDVDQQILSDGGHIERSPIRALAVLAILGEIRDALSGHQIEPPNELISAIDRMVPFIKAMRHGDGGFALMGGSSGDTGPLIDAVLQASAVKGKAMTSAPHTGFHRLRAGQTTLIVDCGETRIIDPTSYQGPGSFELSVGKIRVLTNCGTRLADDSQQAAWSNALARTAAHTTVVINDKDAGPLTSATVDRRDHEGARLIEIRHDGYFSAFNMYHQRAIYLDAGGNDLRGEDIVTGSTSQPFSIRFHIFPGVSASMVSGGGEVILKPPKGRGWRFTCRYPVMLEDSVCFYDGQQHRAQQIVVLGNHEPEETTVKWRFKMEG